MSDDTRENTAAMYAAVEQAYLDERATCEGNPWSVNSRRFMAAWLHARGWLLAEPLTAERARLLDVKRLALAIERSGFAFDSPDAAYAIAREYAVLGRPPMSDEKLVMPKCIVDHAHNHDEGDCVYPDDDDMSNERALTPEAMRHWIEGANLPPNVRRAIIAYFDDVAALDVVDRKRTIYCLIHRRFCDINEVHRNSVSSEYIKK